MRISKCWRQYIYTSARARARHASPFPKHCLGIHAWEAFSPETDFPKNVRTTCTNPNPNGYFKTGQHNEILPERNSNLNIICYRLECCQAALRCFEIACLTSTTTTTIKKSCDAASDILNIQLHLNCRQGPRCGNIRFIRTKINYGWAGGLNLKWQNERRRRNEKEKEKTKINAFSWGWAHK